MSEVISLRAPREARDIDTPGSRIESIPSGPFEVRAVHTAVPGRARYRVERLYRSESLKRRIEADLAGKEGILSVSANILTGSVLILFERDRGLDRVTVLLNMVVAAASIADPHPASTGEREASATSSYSSWRQRLGNLVGAGTTQEKRPWHRLATDEVLVALGTARSGLAVAAAEERFKQHGPNLLPQATPRSALSMFIGQFKSLPVGLLGVSAVVSIATGGVADAAVILGVVLINAVIGYVTESQAEKTIKSLTGPMHPTALVFRDNVLQAVPVERIVVGDVLALAPGSYVGADARLLEARYLSVDESSLTGESLPASKNLAAVAVDDTPLADRFNMVYMGTQVTGGQGLAVVIATGAATEIGRIQTLVGEAQSPETPMERQLRTLGNQMVVISAAVCAGVFVVGLLRGYGLLQMLKTAISLAVAAVPEGLPTVATTTLAIGIARMRERKVLIRQLEAVETLGAVQMICLDKTGTLTLNRMSVVAAHSGLRRFSVSNGNFLAGGRAVIPSQHDELLRLIHVAVLCNETEINGHGRAQALNGSATENALVHMALAADVDVSALRARYPRLHVDYRAENRLYMTTVHTLDESRKLVAVKGSPAEVLALSRWYVRDGAQSELDAASRQEILDENERMAGDAMRVLGMAYAVTPDPSEALNGNLVWLGLVGMADPIREGVPNLIGEFHRAGIDTVMITGDQSPTAYAIGRALRLSGNDHLEIVDSTHLEQLNRQVLKGVAQRIHVFARVSPSHKLQIVRALQNSGRVVAMTGDGINDGPALKAADIGIAMGRGGTDVARTVADVVLEDDNLETLIIAVSQGRTIYNNIRKSIHFLLATNLSEIAVMFTAITAGMGQPLNPMQLLWINLITDIFPGLALAMEPPEPDVLRRPPRDPRAPIVATGDFKRLAFEATTLSAGALAAYGYGLARYGAGPQAGTLAFMGLTSAQLLHALSCRSERRHLSGKERLPPNPYLRVAIGGSLAIQTAAALIPGLRQFLGIGPIGLVDGAVIGGAALLPFIINEATKPAESAPNGNNPIAQAAHSSVQEVPA
ncbi:MAG TPA: HAD-IC family P-type ATPase [Candidatus Methylomirabilis sp.]|nr:HAD-IC family P-type ATPase [Candidatus Methylomirabilis sp.]